MCSVLLFRLIGLYGQLFTCGAYCVENDLASCIGLDKFLTATVLWHQGPSLPNLWGELVGEHLSDRFNLDDLVVVNCPDVCIVKVCIVKAVSINGWYNTCITTLWNMLQWYTNMSIFCSRVSWIRRYNGASMVVQINCDITMFYWDQVEPTARWLHENFVADLHYK